jgi:hypothetical protein
MPLTIKQYLKNRFPQLGTNHDMNGGDTVDALDDLYAEADSRRSVVTRPILLDKNVQLYNDDETYTEAGKAYARAVGNAVLDAYVAAARVGPNEDPRTTIVDAITYLLHAGYAVDGSVGELEHILRCAQNHVSAEIGVPVQI